MFYGETWGAAAEAANNAIGLDHLTNYGSGKIYDALSAAKSATWDLGQFIYPRLAAESEASRATWNSLLKNLGPIEASLGNSLALSPEAVATRAGFDAGSVTTAILAEKLNFHRKEEYLKLIMDRWDVWKKGYVLHSALADGLCVLAIGEPPKGYNQSDTALKLPRRGGDIFDMPPF